jgi:hypothetical protein
MPTRVKGLSNIVCNGGGVPQSDKTEKCIVRNKETEKRIEHMREYISWQKVRAERQFYCTNWRELRDCERFHHEAAGRWLYRNWLSSHLVRQQDILRRTNQLVTFHMMRSALSLVNSLPLQFLLQSRCLATVRQGTHIDTD